MNRQLFEYHPVIGFRFIPDLKTRVAHEAGGYLVQTNNWGFRAQNDFEKGKKYPSKKRILVFGDSFTAGDGVSNKFRFTDLIQNSRDDIELFNFAVSATGTDQQYLIYKEYAREVEADIIIIIVLVENIRRVNAHYRYHLNDSGEKVVYQKPYFEMVNDELILRNVPVKKELVKLDELKDSEQNKVDRGGRFETLRKWIKNVGLQDITQRIFHYQPLPEYNSASGKEWMLMKSILKKWVSELGDTKVLLVPFPLYQYIEGTSNPESYQKRFTEIAEELNISLFDPLEDLKMYTKKQKRAFRFQTDIHLSPLGHEAVFKALQKKLIQLI